MAPDINGHSHSEKEALMQLRKNMSDVLTPDVTDKVLLKWLRAKNFHLRKSEEIYRTNLKCRQAFKFDKISELWKIPEVLLKYEFANGLGVAKDGTPIRYIAMGRGDLRGLLQSLDVYDIGKYCVSEVDKDLKRCKEQSKKLGKEINECTYIVDMTGFNLRHVWWSSILELALDLFRLLQDHYPEVWQNILIVNAPFYFQTVFNFFKPIFRAHLLEKIHVVSRYRTAPLLLKYIDADVLPAFLGGKLVDSTGDPMCSEFMKFGGVVPEKYYLRNRTPLLPTDTGVEDVWVPAKSCYNIIVVARQADSTIWVEIRSEGGSVPGMLMYRPFGPDPENVDLPGRDECLDPSDPNSNVQQCGPYVHLQTHFSPIDNCCYAPWPGIYIFKLDNSYNWLTARRVIYRMRVVPPEGDSADRTNQN